MYTYIQACFVSLHFWLWQIFSSSFFFYEWKWSKKNGSSEKKRKNHRPQIKWKIVNVALGNGRAVSPTTDMKCLAMFVRISSPLNEIEFFHKLQRENSWTKIRQKRNSNWSRINRYFMFNKQTADDRLNKVVWVDFFCPANDCIRWIESTDSTCCMH